MGLSLVVGPAHAGKVALLLDRFVEEIDRDPWLVVPNRAEVDRAERELVGRCNGLLAGTVGTFDSLFESLALSNGGGRRPLGEAERQVLLRRVVEAAEVPGSRHPGFTDALARTVAWYRAHHAHRDPAALRTLCVDQIEDYAHAA